MNGTQPTSADHPVWDVYDELRTARLNVLYLQEEIKVLTRMNYLAEILIAIATTSSVGSFWFLQNSVGHAFWKTMGSIAVIFSIVKPILKLPHHIQAKEKLFVNYTMLAHDLTCIRYEIKQKQKYDNALYKDFSKAMNRKAELLKTSVQSRIRQSLRRKCEELVLQELPDTSFYIPKS